MTGETSTVETTAEYGADDAALVKRWADEIDCAENDPKRMKWVERCRKIDEKYRNEAELAESQRQFAMLWSNTEILKPAIYSQPPNAVVTRRHRDEGPLARIAAECMERCANFALDHGYFHNAMEHVRSDYLLFARGALWVRYVADMRTVTPRVPLVQGSGMEGEAPAYMDQETGEPFGDLEAVQFDEAGPYRDGDAYEEVEGERVEYDYVAWADFLHNPARTWAEVRWVARRVFLTRDELVTRFGDEIGKAVPLDWDGKQGRHRSKSEMAGPEPDIFGKAVVYEIWDRGSRTVYWVSRAHSRAVLDKRPDPLRLRGFFPCPEPICGTTGTSTYIPVPDYIYYQDQAEEVDALTQRIAKLLAVLKVAGLYPAGGAEGEFKNAINSLLGSGDNVLIPVQNWQSLKDGGGLKGFIEWLPLEQIVQTLQACFEARRQLIDDIFQITGISDIVRGASDPNETATAQGIKAQWGSLRVRDKQRAMQRIARDTVRITAEIVAEHFAPETLARMSGLKLPTSAERDQAAQLIAASQQYGQEPPPDAIAAAQAPATWEDVTGLLRDDLMRRFVIEVETDSTIEADENEDKQRRVEAIAAVGEFFAAMLPVVTAAPQMMPMVGQMLRFLLKGFRITRELEDVIDRTMEQLETAAMQPPPPPPPDPAIELKQQEIAQKGQIEQGKMQLGAAKLGLERERLMLEGAKVSDEAEARARDQVIDAAAAMQDPEPQVVT